MTSTTATTEDTSELADVLARLTRARNLQEALAPLARLVADAEEEARAAAVAATAAGLSERTIAVKIGYAQPTVHGWLDGRSAAPLPAPLLADRVWMLHHTAQTLASIVQRMHGEQVPSTSPTGAHVAPRPALAEARNALTNAAFKLGQAGSAIEYDANRR